MYSFELSRVGIKIIYIQKPKNISNTTHNLPLLWVLRRFHQKFYIQKFCVKLRLVCVIISINHPNICNPSQLSAETWRNGQSLKQSLLDIGCQKLLFGLSYSQATCQKWFTINVFNYCLMLKAKSILLSTHQTFPFKKDNNLQHFFNPKNET